MLSDKPEDRAIAGASSGAICAFTVAWHRPDALARSFHHREFHEHSGRPRLPGTNCSIFQKTHTDLSSGWPE